MARMFRNVSPLLLIVAAHFAILAQGAMLGCEFTAPDGAVVDTDEDSPNSYTCGCRCGIRPTLTSRVSASLDDVESPQTSDPDGATDLDLGGGASAVAVRFTALAIPPGAVVTAATVQFTADGAFGADNTLPTNLDVYAQAIDDAPPFPANVVNNLGALSRTSASVGWIIPPWAVSQSGPAQRTPDLSAIIQELVNRPGWRSGNALVMVFVGGGGRREAEAFDGTPARAPLLSVTFDVNPVQALNVCMPETLNPNLPDANGVEHPAPQPDQLQADCEGRVQKTFGDLALACGYPAQCDCDLVPSSQRFNLSCNDPCAEVPLDPRCANFNPPVGNVGATNVPGDAPVCVVPLPTSNRVGPSAIAGAMYGQQSECQVHGPATFSVGDEEKTTPAHGVIGLFGEPCPQGQCAVGLSYGLTMNEITFEIRFHSDPVFKDLAASGATVANAALVDASGSGQVGAQQTDSSVRGRRNSDTRAYALTNPNALDVFVDWDGHACALYGDLAGTAGADEEGDQSLTAAVSLEGEIVNEPPHASAGQDQTVECTSPSGAAVMLDASASSDPEDNAVLFSWFRDGRSGPPIGFGQRLERQQELGGPATYHLRVIDELGQSDEDATAVRVVDTTAPSLAVTVSPIVLWPPNHKLVPVTLGVTAGDACDSHLTLRLVSIASNEGDLANGSGHTSPDIQGAQFGTDDRQFLLRAERRGGAIGRVYTITYEAQDASGNVTTRQVTVKVPA